MKLLKKSLWIIYFVFLFISLIYLFDFRLSGKAIYDFNNFQKCDSQEIVNFWKNVFNVNNDGIYILNNGECVNFIAYKKEGNKFYYISYSKQNKSGLYNLKNFSGKFEKKSKEMIKVGFLKLKNNILDKILLIKDVGSLDSYLNGLEDDNFLECNLNIKEDALKKFKEIFKGSDINFDEKIKNYYSFKKFEWIKKGGFVKSIGTIKFISKNYCEAGIGYLINSYSRLGNFEMYKKIPDLNFEKNSGWNVGIKLNDYFTGWKGTDINFSFTGKNNSNGSFINFKITNGSVYFRPKTGFVGSRRFIISLSNGSKTIFSNKFKVNILNSINLAPILREKIGTINIPRNKSVDVLLNLYFYDPDGDNLSYTFDGGKNLILKLEKNKLTIRLKDSFNKHDSFTIYVSDGKNKINEKIDVFSESLNKKEENKTLLIEGNNKLDSFFRKSFEKSEKKVKNNNYLFIRIGITLLILEILFIIIYFILIKKRKREGDENKSDKVKDYLIKLMSKNNAHTRN